MLRLVVVTGFAALLLAGCSGSDSGPKTTDPSSASPAVSSFGAPVKDLPEGVEPNLTGTAGAGIATANNQLWVFTYGSTSNPLAVVSLSVDGQKISVKLAAKDGPSTMDLVPTTSTVDVPTSVAWAKPIEVDLSGRGVVTLDPTQPGSVAWLPAS